MRRLFVLLLLCPGIAWAGQTVSFLLHDIRLVELTRIVYGDVVNKSFLLDAEFLQLRDTVSLSLRAIAPAEAEKRLEEMIEAKGFEARRRGSVVVVHRKPEDDEREIFYYRPRHRSVGYIVDLVSSLFKPGSFSLQRQVSMPAQSVAQGPVMQPQKGNKGSAQQPPATDGGSSALSLIDKQPDAFIFRGSAKEIERFKDLLTQVDAPVPELLVKAIVYEVANDTRDGSALSLAVSILKGRFGARIDQGSANNYALLFKNANIDLVYSALATDSRFKVVSAPSLRVRSGASARFSVGAEVPILGAAQLDKNGNPVQSVEYRPSGVILDLKPQVREDTTELSLFQQVSNFIPTTTGVNQSPTLLKRELATNVGVRTDDILVLGGLDEEKTSEEENGLSFLPRWMRASGTERRKTEILMVLHVQRL